jgi:hypothetical protein
MSPKDNTATVKGDINIIIHTLSIRKKLRIKINFY